MTPVQSQNLQPTMCLTSRVFWGLVLTASSSKRPERFNPATDGSRSRVPQPDIRQSPGVLRKRERKDWRNQRAQEYHENMAHKIN